MKESQIQRLIIKKLEKDGWLVVKIISCTKAGWPDLQAHRAGITIFLEIKRAGGKPSQLQLYRHDELIKQGFKVLVCDNHDNLII